MTALLAAFQCFPLHHAAAGPGDGQAAQEVPWPASWWPVSTPEDQGMDSASLARLIENVGGYKRDSLTVVRHGRIVADAYYAPCVAGVSHGLRTSAGGAPAGTALHPIASQQDRLSHRAGQARARECQGRMLQCRARSSARKRTA